MGRDRKGKKRLCCMAVILLCVLCSLSGCTSAPGAESGSGSGETVEAYLEAGSYQDAVTACQELIADSGETENRCRLLGIAEMGTGSYTEAAQAFETALTYAGVIPGDMEFDINYFLGVCYYKLERYDDALQVYDAIVVLRPRSADAVEMRGAVRMQLGDEDGMDDDFRKAIDLEPSNYDRLVSIYETLSSGGREDVGRQYIQEVLDRSGSGMSNYDRGRLSYYTGDYDTARTCLEQVQDNTNPDVALMLGRTYEALGDYNYATNVFRTYLAADSTHAEVYNELGLCCLRMENYSDALQAFRDGEQLQDQNYMQSLSFNEIVACEYLGQFQQAKTLMEAYTASYPGDEKAKREYTFLKSR